MAVRPADKADTAPLSAAGERKTPLEREALGSASASGGELNRVQFAIAHHETQPNGLAG